MRRKRGVLVHWVRIPHYDPGPVIWNHGSSTSVLYQQRENLVPRCARQMSSLGARQMSGLATPPSSMTLSMVRDHCLRLGERLVFIHLKSKGRIISWGTEEVPECRRQL